MTDDSIHKNRAYLPNSFDATSPNDVKTILLRLQSEVPDSMESAKKWFGLFSEMSSAMTEIQTHYELALQLDTKNEESKSKLKFFEDNILGELLTARENLISIYLNSPWKFAMHPDEGGRIELDLKNRKKFSSPSLVRLQLEENQLVRDYRSWLSHAQTQFRGRDTSLSIVVGRLSDPDASIREAAFFSYWKCIKNSEDNLQEMFQKLLDNRNEQAQKANTQSYAAIAFSELGRIDYSENDCKIFRDAIHKHVVPIVTELSKNQAYSLKKQSIKPWDISAWPQLIPHELPAKGNLQNLMGSFPNILGKMHPEFLKLYNLLSSQNRINITPERNKAPGAFTVTFPESGLPFVFGNFSATQRDAFTLLHEFGHAAHGYLSSHIQNSFLRTPGLEFCELAAISFELLSFPHLNEWWSEEDATRVRASHLYSLLNFWPFMALMDEFQHVLYSMPNCSAEERNELWKKLSRKYRPHLNWDGCEEFEGLGWFSRQHIFSSPFYYIDYGIAQLGAVQLWLASEDNYKNAISNYIKALGLGAQRSLPELFRSLGAEISFSSALVEDLAKGLKKQILRSSGSMV